MDNDSVPSQPQYRALDFLVRYGGWLPPVLAGVVAFLGVYAWALGMPAVVAVAGVGAAAFAYLMMRAFVELVRVIVDMLLPK